MSITSEVAPARSPAFSAHYTHTYEDYLAVILAQRKRSAVEQWRYVIWFALYLLMMLYLSPRLRQPEEWSFVLLALVLGIGLLAMIAVFIVRDLLFDRLIYRTHYERLLVASRPVDIDLDDEGVRWRTPNAVGKLLWPGVQDIVTLPDVTVLFFSRLEGLVLPARAFATPQAYADAIAFAAARAHRRVE